MIDKDLCVEGIKLFKPHHIEDLFGGEDCIVMLHAKLAWEDLGVRDQYRFKKPNPNLNNSTKTNSDPPDLAALHHHHRTRRKLTSCIRIACHLFFKFGFSTKVTKNNAENIREKDKREALRKKQKLENCIINIDDDYDIDFGGLGVVGDTV